MVIHKRVQVHSIQRLVVLLAIAMLVLVCELSSPTLACSCAAYVSLEQELERSDVIFAGKVISVESKMPGKTTFEVSHVWRGSIPSVIGTSNVFDCNTVFRAEEEYLVFAHRIVEEPSREYDLVVNRCGRTGLLQSSSALTALGPSAPPLTRNEKQLTKVWLLVGGGIVVLAFFLILARLIIARKVRRSSV